MEPFRPPKAEDDWIALQFEVTNLFSAGPIDEERLFAGRTHQIATLLETVFERSKHAILFGERGVGKTSISNVFWKRFGQSLQTVVAARVQADPSDTFASLWIKALEELVAFARFAGREALIPISTNYDIVSPDTVRRELQRCLPNSIPILIIDEFDKLRDPDAKELTANLVMSLSDYSINVTVILIGVAETVSELIADHESVRRPLMQVKLERMSTAELNQIIDTRLSLTPLKIHGDARWKIVMLARGLPFYVHMLGKYAFQSCISRRRMTIVESDVDEAMDRFISSSDEAFFGEYRTATDSNQPGAIFKDVLLACAIAKQDDAGFFTPTNIVAPLSRIIGREVAHANFQRHLSEFISEDRGGMLVRRGRERQYRFRFRDPMMQPYVIIKGIRDGMVDEATKAVLSSPEEPSLPI